MKPRKAGLTDQELEIMKVVWKLGTATVREVYEELLQSRKIAYTTVQTMMGVLENKGRLKKATADKAYVYRPALVREARISRDHEQPAEPRQAGNDVLDHPISKVLLLRIATQVREWKHRNRRLVSRTRAGLAVARATASCWPETR